jgi:F-type H+-transporting ATPase subunit a
MDKAITWEVLGKKGRPYAPYLMAMFFLILFLNSTGILPPMHIPVTSVIGVPIVFAAVTYIVFNVSGIRKLGFGHYMKANVAPPGIPTPLYILVIPIEFVSTFLLRPFTLAIRLMANMMAGHLLLVLFYSATSYFLFEASGALKAVGVVSYAAGFAFTLFELLVIFLQAYIFTLLTAVYIDGALSEEH